MAKTDRLKNNVFLWGLLVLQGLFLVACSSDPNDKIIVVQDHGEKPAEYNVSLLSLGRALSNGAVDIYDPHSDNIHILPPRKPLIRPLSFPLNATYTPKDAAVKFYTLTIPGDDLEVFDPKPLSSPVPLKESKERRNGQ